MNTAILEVRPGPGGDEARIWASDLVRMYSKFATKKGWKVKSIGETTLKITGHDAFKLLKNEGGVHRVQRVPTTEKRGRIHTSTASVAVLPEIPKSEVIINSNDIEWEFFRASSHGGQNVQKVSSAARLKHKPTNIVVTCQSQRTQEQNRKIAFQLLKAKLWAQKEIQIKEKEKKLKGEYKPASWGHQIRSYVLHPYKMVKDLRTGVESGEPTKVLDGDLDDFVSAQVKM